ncbi:DNA topoisomerase III [Limisphaera ngatamarikiensis]|uniref:DNA topoisomerase n=1 Tax=Limisphaera ngatamarikiensis TaxID=1324935 RepID=A0A6M1RFV6_9BACT|nr:DNA topoisomerase III [Limisphaera ngatamarikiensis]NGO38486.1 DNA topoisomerase III [Limisphaera ngatamarikiensis]
MGKALVIAEKPSVAADIARALGGCKKVEDHYENDRYVIASAVGHLLELTPPEGVEPARGKWSFNHLPVLPDHFDLVPIEKNQARLKQLVRLIRRPDIDEIINACDAGREGELIFRNIIRYAGTQKPIRRLWLQSMTPAAIREGFEHLRSDEEMQPLADAALSRAEADWLVGINGTRAMTAFNSRSGGFFKTTVGRVQTPTLAIVVEREQRIRRFVPRPYWELIATFECAAGTYTGRWFNESFVKSEGRDADPDQKPERIWEPDRAEALRQRCLGQPGEVTEESKPTTQAPPLLFDLTSLQREANARFGFSANRTLQIAQTLYERHKVITYPRTDSRALPEDYLGTVRATLESLTRTAYAPWAGEILRQDWVRPNKRIFNNARVSDHFAIIPTTQTPRGLNEAEQKIYDLVTRRFLAVFYPPAEYLEITRITRVAGEPFKSVGRTLLKAGWLTVYGREIESEDETQPLPPVQPGEQVHTREIEIRANQTKPPPRFTEATLLTAMEGAGKLVEDDELREAMRDKGLGTPATRAAIIEGLIEEKYLVRQGRELVPTAKAFALMELLHGLGIPELTRPELTGDWEYQLRQVQRRQKTREEFMQGIREMTRRIVERARQYQFDTIPGDFGALKVPCPKCGGEVHEKYKAWQCVQPGCDFAVPKILGGRMFEPEEVETLLRQRQVGPLQGFRSKNGRPFSAILRLNDAGRVEFDFGQGTATEAGSDAGETSGPPDFTGREPVGPCPRCGARVFEAGMHYVCEKAVGPDKSCSFRVGRVILQQPVEPAQMRKILTEGKSDLLSGFVSNRNHRRFEAHLVLRDGDVKFEFAPRTAEKAGRRSKTTARKAPDPVDLANCTVLGTCPRCKRRVFETASDYRCEGVQDSAKPCTFLLPRVLHQQPLEPAQVQKLLKERRTDLLRGFVSAKTGRPFAAYLVLGPRGKLQYEFPDRSELEESATRDSRTGSATSGT